MIELAHMATGVLAGRRCSGPADALLAGVVLHAIGDVTPHGEVNDRTFEVGSTAVGVGVLAARYGLQSPIVWGAIGSVLPDVEHVLPARLRSPRGYFPTHRFEWLHRSGGPLAIPAWLQVVVGGAIIGAVAAGRRPLDPSPPGRLEGALAMVERFGNR